MMIVTSGKRRRHAASEYLRQRWGLHFAPTTMANLAVTGEGPIYRLVGKYAVYADEDLDSWARSRITSPRRKASGDLIDETAPSDNANTDRNTSSLPREPAERTTDNGVHVRDALGKACVLDQSTAPDQSSEPPRPPEPNAGAVVQLSERCVS